MAAWDDMLAADAPLFTDPDGFGGEAVVYTPKGGTPRTVNAQVFREPYSETPGGRPAPSLRVFVRRHATAGISSLDKDGDTVTVAERRGGTAAAHRIAELVSEDAGGFMLRLR